MTEKEAISRMEKIIREAVGVLEPEPRLESIENLSQRSSCDPDDGGSPEQTVLNRSYLLRGVPQSSNGEIARKIKGFWDRQGYKIDSAVRLDGNKPQVLGLDSSGDFSLGLITSGDGVLEIGATSPCVLPLGTGGA
ncbi:hypothetical protein, partial [Actinomadura rubrisoli]